MTDARPRHALPFLLVAAVVAAIALVALLRSAGPADAASRTVSVRMSDFRIRATPSGVRHGRITFRVRNAAGMDHELVVIKTKRRANRLPVHDGRASERGSRGKVEVEANDDRRLTLNLSAGHYVLICNVQGHYQAGMRTDFTVR